MIEFCLLLIVILMVFATAGICRAAEAICRWTSFDIQQTHQYESAMQDYDDDESDDDDEDCPCDDCKSEYQKASKRGINPITGRCPHGYQDTDLCPDCCH